MDGDTGDGYSEDNFGLFQTNGSAKPAATAIHNMTTILNATNAGGTNFSTSGTPTISNLPSGAASLMLKSGQGGYNLLVWNEASSLGSLSVSLGATYSYVYVYDPVQSTSPIQSFSKVSKVTLTKSSDLLIVAAVP